MKKTLFTLLLSAAVSNVSFASGYNKENDARHQKECMDALNERQAEIDAYVNKREGLLLASIKIFFDAHKITWNKPETALEGLKALRHQELSEIQKLAGQLKGFKTGTTGSKAKCENLAALLRADYEKFYNNVEGDASKFLHGFLKCPSELTTKDMDNLRTLQDASGDGSTPIKVNNPYFKNTVAFYVNHDNTGSYFPKLRVISKAFFGQNSLLAEKIRTEGNRTYCPYKWSSASKNHETIIYYRNDK